MIADPILEGAYRTSFASPQYCSVWCEKGAGWENSLATFSYDLIVVDLSLFPEDPIDSLRQVRENSPIADIIVLSSNDDVKIAIAAFKMGIKEYFLKPTSPEQLEWAVEKTLRQRQLNSTNLPFAADLDVFRAAHHISMAENDLKMRELAIRSIISMTHAKGGVWVWPEEKGKFKTEVHRVDEEEGKSAWEGYRAHMGGAVESSFESHLTSHPEQWFDGTHAWIPLKNSWMGGIFLFGVNEVIDKSGQARAEFLVRNLELSLENGKRYLEAKQLSYVDEFTGLYNNRYLDIALDSAIDGSLNTNVGFSVLFIDVDHFKSVNDRFGHMTGSGLLIGLADFMKRLVRGNDQLFRYGGDEFIIILNGSGNKEAVHVAERMRAQIEKHKFHILGNDINITVSIGVSRFPEHSKSKKNIIELADKAMYSGKSRGRNAVYEAIP